MQWKDGGGHLCCMKMLCNALRQLLGSNWDKPSHSNKKMLILIGTGTGKDYISVYRSLAGIWIIFALAWLALILNMGTKIMEHVIVLTHPGFKKQEEDEGVSSSTTEDTSKV